MTRSLQEVTRDRREVESRLNSMRDEVAELTRSRESHTAWDDGKAERLSRVEAGVTNAIARRSALTEEERDALSEFAERNPESREDIAQDEHRERGEPDRGVGAHRTRALRVVERATYLSARAADNLDTLIRDAENDPSATAARYVAAVADPAYARAFWLTLRNTQTAHLDMTPEELRAMQAVRREQRALALGSDPDGGFAVPFQLDPTILLTSDGVINPLRSVARVVSMIGKEWQGVTSEGITVSRADEAEEASDDSPTFAQPTVRANRVQGFIPFSFELGQDWGSLQSEMGRLLADAKDVEEAASFTTGSGIGIDPGGVISTMPAGSLVETAGSGTFAIGDVYKLLEAVPPRYQPRLRALASLATINAMRRFVGGGNTTEMPVVNESLDRLLGKPMAELSTMDSTVVAGAKPLIVGDFSGFLIVDRLGMSIELIPHLFGANGRPTGQRGLYAIWRNNSIILNANAFRVLKVKA
jgi:HK97 family phage major capsid protein